ERVSQETGCWLHFSAQHMFGQGGYLHYTSPRFLKEAKKDAEQIINHLIRHLQHSWPLATKNQEYAQASSLSRGGQGKPPPRPLQWRRKQSGTPFVNLRRQSGCGICMPKKLRPKGGARGVEGKAGIGSKKRMACSTISTRLRIYSTHKLKFVMALLGKDVSMNALFEIYDMW
ncbi:hypothetical protein B0H14DRAFT_2343959, partial [Mycena olivaceomarginata]